MGIYSKADILDKVQDVIISGKRLYSQPFVNYRGVAPTGEPYTEIIAEYLLENPKGVDSGIKRVTRNKSYITKSHDGTMPRGKSNRLEERVLLEMFNQEYPNIGKVLDYQVPLKNTNSDTGVGKIDLVSYNKKTKVLYILELKKPDSQETLLRCILQAYTYWRTIDIKKLIADFANLSADISSATVLSSVLVFAGSSAHEEYLKGNDFILKLMENLGVHFNLLDGDSEKEILSALACPSKDE